MCEERKKYNPSFENCAIYKINVEGMKDGGRMNGRAKRETEKKRLKKKKKKKKKKRKRSIYVSIFARSFNFSRDNFNRSIGFLDTSINSLYKA